MTTAIDSNSQAARRTEALWFMLACLTFIVLEIGALSAWVMVTRPFWLDELCTYLVAGTQSLPASIRSLAAGADFNPPGAFLVYRAAGSIAGGLTPIVARLVASACVLGALTTVYILLRDQFSPWASAIGALAVWTQQVVMHAAFEARFYGPLLVASGLLLLALLHADRREGGWMSALSLALASIAVCTVHYFGILSWAISIATVVLSSTDSRGATVRRLLPTLAGPVALAACLPLYIGQRSAMTVPTWIPSVTVIEAARLLAIFLLTLPLAVALACWAVMVVAGWRRGDRMQRPTMRRLALGPRLLLAQVAVPFTLVAFSLLVQPATELRYWIVGAFALAPVVALVVERADTLLRWIATVGIVGASVKTMWGEAGRAHAFMRHVGEDIRIASRLAGSGSLVVARRRDTLYPVLQARPDLRERTAVLDNAPFDPTNTFWVAERDAALVHHRLYGFPNVATPAELDRLPSFYLIEPESGGAPTAKEFPGRVIDRVEDRVFHLCRPNDGC